MLQSFHNVRNQSDKKISGFYQRKKSIPHKQDQIYQESQEEYLCSLPPDAGQTNEGPPPCGRKCNWQAAEYTIFCEHWKEETPRRSFPEFILEFSLAATAAALFTLRKRRLFGFVCFVKDFGSKNCVSEYVRS
jgi:hypothetical protein